MTDASKWDRRYLGLAKHVRDWSGDPSTKHGTVIVRPDNSVASLGYNGFARGCPVEMDEVERQEKYSRVIHGEMNAILNAHEPVRGYTAYVTSGVPCDRCAVHLIQAGIARIVIMNGDEDYWSRWGDAAAKSLGYFDEMGIEWCIIDTETWKVVRSSG